MAISSDLDLFLNQHRELARRYFLKCGIGAAGVLAGWPLRASEKPDDPRLQEAINELETWLTPPAEFRDVSRGKPVPHTLSEEDRKKVGLTRETWQLEVKSDPENPARLRSPLTKANGNALDFKGLLELAETKAVRFAKVMTCLNIGCPLGTGIWEGVPLREILWLTEPRENLRRVFYYGYHNNDEKQLFQSSLAVGRVLEDPFDLPPVILCYKLNGQWLTPERGGPVRVVVPETYGFKSIKWLEAVVLSNLHHANDTYAKGNNDVDSHLKSFAATLSVPTKTSPNTPIPVTGYAQVGISGLKKVQVWVENKAEPHPAGDRYYATAPWVDAEVLLPPKTWGGGIPDEKILTRTLGFDEKTGRPKTWPMRLAKVHWAILLPGLAAGEYTLRSRTIDEKGQAQPMPRPFRKSGHAAIEQVDLKVG